jgi:hypothetical protein
MSDAPYRVVNSSEVEAQFLQVFSLVGAEGRQSEALRAARWIMEELRRTPHEFGESRWETRSLLARFAIGRPVLVEFAIHRTERVVFLRRFALVKS